MSVAFEEVGKHYLLKSLRDIDRLVVYSILNSVLLDEGCLLRHRLFVACSHLGGLELEAASCFEVDELGGTVTEVEVHLVGMMECVEEDDLVLAVPQMAEGVEEGVVLFGADKGVGEDDHERAPVQLLGGLMEGFADVGCAERGCVALCCWGGLAQFFFEELEEVLLVHAAAAAFGLEVYAVADERETEGIALAHK